MTQTWFYTVRWVTYMLVSVWFTRYTNSHESAVVKAVHMGQLIDERMK